MPQPSLQECAAAFDRFAPVLLSAAGGGGVVLGLAGLAALAMRRASAAARHEVWLLGVAGVLLLPILSAALPGWHVLPRPGVSQDVVRPAEFGVTLPSPALSLPNVQPVGETP